LAIFSGTFFWKNQEFPGRNAVLPGKTEGKDHGSEGCAGRSKEIANVSGKALIFRGAVIY
jgi:hypothetical protein